MPIYEYQCESCEQRTEAIQRFDEPPLTLCPHCGGPLVKLMSAPSFQFKGTGWYVTDYGSGKSDGRSEDKAKTASEESASSTATSGKSESSGKDGSSKKAGSDGSKPAS